MKILKTYREIFENKIPNDINNVLDDLEEEFGNIKIESGYNKNIDEITYNLSIPWLDNWYIYYTPSLGDFYVYSSMYIDIRCNPTTESKELIDYIYNQISSRLIYIINNTNFTDQRIKYEDKIIHYFKIEKYLNKQNKIGETALHILMARDYILTNKILKMDFDIDINLKNNDGNTLFLLAATYIPNITKIDENDNMFLLLKKGADLLVRDNKNNDFEAILKRYYSEQYLSLFIKYIESHVNEYENCKEYVKYNKIKKFNL